MIQALPQTPKAKRISIVSLSAAVMLLLWAIADWAGVSVPAPVISALTSLVMLVAGFIDFKHADDIVYDGEPD